MGIRTILAAVSGGSASAGVIEVACKLALDFQAHVELLHVRQDQSDLATAVAQEGMPPALLDQLMAEDKAKSLAATAALHAMYERAIAAHELPPIGEPPAPGPSAIWRDIVGRGSPEIASRSRLFDLTVLGRSGRVVKEVFSDTIENTLLSSGRPVLIAPGIAPSTLGRSIAIAWSDTRESTRALAAAMPFLLKADTVQILSIGDTGAAEVANHLGWHGIKAAVHPLQRTDDLSGIGESLLVGAYDWGADLLVLGGYGHPRWREELFGGVTADLLGESNLPLLLSH